MKKLTFLLVAFVMVAVSFLSFGCGNSDPNHITINEVTHSIFYAPLYVAIEKGYFEEEGLTVSLVNGGGADKSMTAVTTGAAQIGLMGPEAAIYQIAGDAPDQPVVFGQLTKRDGSFLVSKTQINDFEWSDVIGKYVIGGRSGGVPQMTLQYVMKLNSLKPGPQIDANFNVKMAVNISFDATGSAFENTDADFCTLFEPLASHMEERGKGYVVAAIGDYSGDIPYTAFMAKQSYIDQDQERIEKFLRAVWKGYSYIMYCYDNLLMPELANIIAPQFFGTNLSTIISALTRYIEIGAWNATPIFGEDGYNKLHGIIKDYDSNLLAKDVAYSSVVDNTYATIIAQELTAE